MFIFREIPAEHFHVLDNMLQLYVHELNQHFEHKIVLNYDGRYAIKSAAKYLDAGWGYFILVRGEYAGFILMDHETKTPGAVFIAEFFIMPHHRRGLFFQEVIFSLIASLEGIVEYRVLKRNKRALLLSNNFTKRFLSAMQKEYEHDNGEEYFRFTFDVKDVKVDTKKYRKRILEDRNN